MDGQGMNAAARDWRLVGRSIRETLWPTANLKLLGATYRVRRESRIRQAERDYAILKTLAAGKRCVLDVGANMGLTSLVMVGAMDPAGIIVAFEASEAACRLIRQNVVLNGYGRQIMIINAVVAERTGMTIDFYGDHASAGSSIIPGYLAHTQPLSKTTLALDDYLEHSGYVPDLIKIDVEGAELRVIAGLTRTMLAARPLLFIELHSWESATILGSAAELLDQLRPANYSLVYLRTKHVVCDPVAFAGRGRCHVLACPDESPVLQDLESLNTEGL